MTEMTAPLPTPLLDRHEALGAKIVEFAGWLMPIQYAGILEEHRAVRSAAGLFDLSHMGELVVEGPEAGTALAAALITDPPALAVGRAHYSMICADGRRHHRRPDRLPPGRATGSWSSPTPPTPGSVSDTLAERLAGHRAVLDDRSLATGLVAIQGPRSLEILGSLTDLDLAAIRYYGIAEGVVAGHRRRRSPGPATRARTASSCSWTRTGRARSGTRVLDGRPRARAGAGRPGRPRHAAPRGRDAALRQRAGPGDQPVRGGPRAAS